MSSQGSDIQEALPVFKPPVRVSPAATDRVTQQIQSKLGDYRYVKHFLDDPNSSIGVYGEPASPAPGGPQRGVEFKKPHHASTQNGRPHHRVHYYGKTPDGITPGVHVRPAPSHFPPNGKTPPNVGEPNGIPPIENILKEMKSVSMTPLTAIAATPRKETESKFNFNLASIQKINNDSLLLQSNGPSEAKPIPPPKQHLDRHNNPRLSADLERDLLLTDSEDEARKRKTSSVMASPPPAGSTSGSESSSSDSDSDSSSDDSKPTVAGGAEEPAQVVEGPGEAVCSQRPSWSLSNFAPQPPESRQQPPDRQQQQQPAAAESDSCYDSTKEVESVLAAAKGKTETLLSGLSDSEDSSDDRRAKDMRNLIRSSSAVGSSSERSRVSRGRPPRTPARPPPPSSPSEDDSPPPRPEQRKQRGRPRKARPEEDVIKKRRGRPPKAKVPPRPPSSSSDDERPPSSPAAPVRHWHTTDSEGEECSTVTTDKNKNDTLRKLFCAGGGAKGGGKGGAKGGKGKGQVVVIEAHSLEHEKEDDSLQRRLKEEEAFKRLREEEAQRRLKEEEATRRKQEEEATQRRLKEEAAQKRIKEEEALQRRLKDEEMRRKLKEEEAIQRKIKEEEALQRRKEEEVQRRLKEEEAQRREEAIQRRIRENEIAQRRIKEEELMQRKIKEEEISNRRFKEEDALQRRIKEEAIKPKEEDALQRRIREDGVRLRKSGADEAGGGEETATGGSLMVRIDLGRLSSSCMARIRRGKRPPPLPPAPPDKKPKLTVRQNPETTPTNHERAESEPARPGSQPLVYYSYLESGHQDCSSDEESRDHTYYLQEATRLRALAEQECDLLGRVMLYQESVLCFVLTGRVLELELDTKKAFTMYRETMEYIKSIQSMPARHRASPQSTLSKLDILSMRCQALLYLRMFKMYKGEVKEYYKIFQEYLQKPACPEAVGTVSPLSPTPSPAGSVGSVGSAGSSGYGSAAPALTPQHLGSSSSSAPSAPGSAAPPVMLAVPQSAHQAMLCLTKYYSFLHFSYDMWEQADTLIRIHRYTELFVRVDRVCGPLTLHSSFRHLVKYVRYAISILKTQSHRGS